MENKIKKAFGSITAEPELVSSTYANVVKNTKKEKSKKRRISQGLSFAAASVIVLMFVVGINFYSSETTYISLDVNPSISLSVNRFDKVIEAVSYNEEGQVVIENVDVKNLDYTKAVQAIMDSPQMEPYLANAPTMWVTVQANDTSKEKMVESSVQSVVDAALAQHHAETHVEYASVDEQTRVEAETNGLSATKYTAILELQQYDSNVSVEEYKHHSMHDINAEIASHHGSGSSQEHYVGDSESSANESQEFATPQTPDSQSSGDSDNHSEQSSDHNGSTVDEPHPTHTPQPQNEHNSSHNSGASSGHNGNGH